VIDDDPKPANVSKVKLTYACSHCDNLTELQIVIDRFGDQPAYKIFRCSGCGAIDWIAM
jgi:hypothetical protein